MIGKACRPSENRLSPTARWNSLCSRPNPLNRTRVRLTGKRYLEVDTASLAILVPVHSTWFRGDSDTAVKGMEHMEDIARYYGLEEIKRYDSFRSLYSVTRS